MPETAQAVEQKTCTITLVTPGSSDRLIKVFPAEHDTEKIWLDNTQGIERWEVVERLLNNFAERGTRVAKPVPYHSSTKDLARPDLDLNNVPTVRLDGAILKGPPPVEKIDYSKLNTSNTTELSNKIDRLESVVSQLSQALSNIAIANTAPKAAPVVDTEAARCPDCSKHFKSLHGLGIHLVKSHRNK